MDHQVAAILRELERFGFDDDAAATSRTDQQLNIAPETGAFLSLLVQAMKARAILEIGTANGYSTLWLADAARRTGGAVTAVAISPRKAEMALANFRRAGMPAEITLHLGDPGFFLQAQRPETYHLIFLGAERTAYRRWWDQLQRVLVPGGLLVVDHAVSHADELEDFVAAVRATPGYQISLVGMGNGQLLILKQIPAPTGG